MFSTKLSNPTDYSATIKYIDMLNALYSEYEQKVKYFNRSLKIGKVPIYFPLSSQAILGKDEIFWHITGLETREIGNLNTYICSGDERCYKACKNLCEENCRAKKRVYRLNNGSIKHFCIYRASRIVWIPQIIELLNNKCTLIHDWYNYKRVQNKGRVLQYYIRFQDWMCDYIIIFQVNMNHQAIQSYKFITAFPIFFFDEKDKFNRSYDKRIII